MFANGCLSQRMPLQLRDSAKFCLRFAHFRTTNGNEARVKAVVVDIRKVSREVSKMLWTIFVVLLVLWLLGVVSSYTLGGFIHLLLVLALVVLVIQLISGRRAAL
jgi:predicted ferric reductase